jgi:hypothetical protein
MHCFEMACAFPHRQLVGEMIEANTHCTGLSTVSLPYRPRTNLAPGLCVSLLIQKDQYDLYVKIKG